MPTIPTVGFNLEEVTVGGVKLTIWDCGGQEKVNIFIFLHATTSASHKNTINVQAFSPFGYMQHKMTDFSAKIVSRQFIVHTLHR